MNQFNSKFNSIIESSQESEFSRIKFYLEYFENLSPSNFKLSIKDNQIIIDIKDNQVDEKNIHDPVRPGILKKQISGKVTCSKARQIKSKQKNKGNNTAKAAQRFINYHCK